MKHVSLLVMIHVNRDTVVPFQVQHLGANFYFYFFQKSHFDNKKLIIYEILAINKYRGASLEGFLNSKSIS